MYSPGNQNYHRVGQLKLSRLVMTYLPTATVGKRNKGDLIAEKKTPYRPGR